MAQSSKHDGQRNRNIQQPRGWLRVGEGGRVVIPSDVRERLAIEVGDRLWFTVDPDGALRLMTHRGAIRRLQELARPYLAGSGSLADELVKERRAEAAND